MTDFSLTDAITGQPIKRWDRVVMCFISHERSGIARLFPDHPTERCKFASLPIKAQWDGSNFIVDDHDHSVKMTLRAVQVPGMVSSIEGLVEQLQYNPTVKNSPKSYGHSIFACKESTIKLLKKNEFLDQSIDLDDLDFLRKMVLDQYASITPTEKQIKYKEHDVLRRNCGYQALDEIEPLYGISNRMFTDHLVSLLNYNEFYNQKMITDEGDLSQDYWSLFEALHTASFISNALQVMEMDLQPSRMIESDCNASAMNPARISLLASVIDQEMTELVSNTYHNLPEDEANYLLDPLRATMHSAMSSTT